MDLLVHVSAYGIQCQYRINLAERVNEFKSIRKEVDLLKIIPEKRFPWTLSGVGKFHLAGHNMQCGFKWSFRVSFLPFSTMVDGEAQERICSVMNALGTRTREMNPGNRYDNISKLYTTRIASGSTMRVSAVYLFVKWTQELMGSAYSNDIAEEVHRCRNILPSRVHQPPSAGGGRDGKYGVDKLAEWKEEEEDSEERVVDMANSQFNYAVIHLTQYTAHLRTETKDK